MFANAPVTIFGLSKTNFPDVPRFQTANSIRAAQNLNLQDRLSVLMVSHSWIFTPHWPQNVQPDNRQAYPNGHLVRLAVGLFTHITAAVSCQARLL